MIALVSGSNRGIGREVARQLADRGAQVVVTARDGAQAPDGFAAAMELDVASPDSVRALAARVEAELGGLDVLVNNAAGYVDWSETASAADMEAAKALFEINLFGTWRLTQALLPLIRRSAHGRIVNVASGAGSHGDPAFGLTANGGATASYGISKAALNALTAKLAAELAGTGVLVNSVCPGLTATAPGMEAMGARPVPDGAASVVWAVLLEDDGPTGGFFRDGEPLPW